MKEISVIESLVTFINSMDHNNGWWYSIPIPGKKSASNDADYVFPPLAKVFGIHKDAMSIYWLETGCLERHGNEIIRISMKGFDSIVDRLIDKNNFEVSKIHIAGIGRHFCMKLGNTTETPKSIWAKYLKKPRRVHPPLKLASREVTSLASSSIVNAIKNSEEFSNIVQLYLKYQSAPLKSKGINKNATTQSELISKSHKKDDNEIEEEKSLSEEDTNDNNNELLSITDIYKSGTEADIKTNPIMNLFRVPKDNMLTLYRLHYEISKVIKSPDNVISYAHPMNSSRKVNYILLPEGKS